MDGSETQSSSDLTKRVPLSVLNTADFPRAKDRFSAWKANVSPYFHVACDDETDLDRFQANFEVGLMGDLIVGSCQTSAQRFQRSNIKVAQDAHDHLMIQVFLEGETRTRVAGQEVVAKAGDVWMIEMSEAMEAENSDFRNVSLVVPRLLIEGNLRHPDEQHLRRIGGEAPLAEVFRNYTCSLASGLGRMTLSEASTLVPATLRLCEALLNSSGSGARPGIDRSGAEQVMLFTAKRLIEDHLSSPSLSPDSLATSLGLSRSKLYRIFAPLGGVAAYIRTRRLKRSLADLLDPKNAQRPIYDIAYAWRFSSESDYSRAFRRQFDLSPREARQARAVAGSAVQGDALAHEHWLLRLSQ